MKQITYTTEGVCAKQITLEIDDQGKIHNLKFLGGCPGNLSAISKLLEGADALTAATILEGNICRGKNTSCADQLSKAIRKNM